MYIITMDPTGVEPISSECKSEIIPIYDKPVLRLKFHRETLLMNPSNMKKIIKPHFSLQLRTLSNLEI